MQAYGPGFAYVYDRLWSDFAHQVAPRVRALFEQALYEQKPAAEMLPPRAGPPLAVLDLCCGTGQLAQHFLEHGYQVTGLDLSAAMLEHARRNTAGYAARGQARFVQADAADFSLDDRFGLVASTYDALNHLESMKALQGCFRSVHRVLAAGGLFVFDLNTRVGLGRWAGQRVQELEDITFIQRGHLDPEAGKAWMTISGFVRRPDGLYERFEETVFNTMFDMNAVQQALRLEGFAGAYPALPEDLVTPVAAPEEAGRIFFVARRL